MRQTIVIILCLMLASCGASDPYAKSRPKPKPCEVVVIERNSKTCLTYDEVRRIMEIYK